MEIGDLEAIGGRGLCGGTRVIYLVSIVDDCICIVVKAS